MVQLFVRSIKDTFMVDLEESATVEDLRAIIEDREFIPSGESSPVTLTSYAVVSFSIMFVCASI